MILLKKIVLLFLILYTKIGFTQIPFGNTIRPEVFAGYILKSGLDFGLGITIDAVNYKINSEPNSDGINASITFYRNTSGIDQTKTLYKTFTLNYVHFYSNKAFVKIGKVKNVASWGNKAVNKAKSKGINFEAGYSPILNTYLSFRHFGLNNPCTGPPLISANLFNVNYIYPIQYLSNN